MKGNMHMDYLHGTDCQILQHPDMFHSNSDTELLGCFMHVRRKDRVLDIGTNNGALLLYAAKHHPCYMHGIDLFEEVIQTARANAELNRVEMHFTVSRLQEFQSDPFDLIVCNPPYFHTQNEQLKNENRYLRAARHQEYLCLDDLFSNVRRLLKDNGRFDMVYRPTDLFRVFTCARQYGFFCNRMRIAYAAENRQAKTVLLEFQKKKSGETRIEAPAFLNDRSSYGWEDSL